MSGQGHAELRPPNKINKERSSLCIQEDSADLFVNLVVGHVVRIDLPDDRHALGRVRVLAARLGNVEPVAHEAGDSVGA